MRTLPILRSLGIIVAAACALAAAVAQTAPTGTIEGRVFNPASGEYLEFVRVTVEGTSLEALTDASGQYRVSHVPAGLAKVRAFRTGAVAQTEAVTVAAGGTATLDFNLTSVRGAAVDEPAVKMEKFVVNTAKEMDGAAIAINTQRFADNAVSVVSMDDYIAQIEVGELLKVVPGINIEPGGGDLLRINGVPADNVPVSVNGFDMANATYTSTRQISLEQFSINNVARIEVAFTPTPETTGSALAGSVNMVPRNAFERAKPLIKYSAYFSMRDSDLHLRSTPGPVREPTPKVRPVLEVSAIVPVNDWFGFTVSASRSSLYTIGDFIQSSWRGVGVATNGNTLPDTTPDRPYLTDFQVGDQPRLTKQHAFSATLDFKLGRNDRLSLSFMRSFIDFYSNNHNLNFFVNRVAPGNFTPTSVRGFAGAGEIRLTNGVGVFGGTVYTPSLTYQHTGPVWRIEAGAGHSHATRHNHNIYDGHFANVQARRQNVTVSFDDVTSRRPGVITVTDGATGAAIDPYSLANYTLNTTSGTPLENSDVKRRVYANLQRAFSGRVPFLLKTGLDVRQNVKDLRNPSATYTFVGADRRANTADDNAAVVYDENFSQRIAPFGFPRIQWASNHELWDLWQAHPEYFTVNEATRYTSAVAASKRADEVLSAAFVRGDLQLLGGRLKLVGGLRAEQTNVKGEGQLVDPTRNYLRNAAGQVLRDANGRPLPITTNALEAAQLTTIERGLRTNKEYLRLFPSLNTSYNLRENFIARAGYYHSVGRPNFVQYAGSLTLPNTEDPPAPDNRIAVNNAGIKAWSARTTKVSLEYYFEPAGLLSIGAFQRDIENFFGSTVFRATPEFLALYGLDPEIYGDYDVNTQYNLETSVRMTGLDFSYKQALTFLPSWARGVQVYVNGSALRAVGDDSNNFQGYVPRTANVGISLSRPRYKVQVRSHYTSRRRLGPIANGRSIEAGTYNWVPERFVVDLIGEYYFNRRLAVFANLSNIADAPVDREIAGPNTPTFAQPYNRQYFGALWNIGLKGTF